MPACTTHPLWFSEKNEEWKWACQHHHGYQCTRMHNSPPMIARGGWRMDMWSITITNMSEYITHQLWSLGGDQQQGHFQLVHHMQNFNMGYCLTTWYGNQNISMERSTLWRCQMESVELCAWFTVTIILHSNVSVRLFGWWIFMITYCWAACLIQSVMFVCWAETNSICKALSFRTSAVFSNRLLHPSLDLCMSSIWMNSKTSYV